MVSVSLVSSVVSVASVKSFWEVPKVRTQVGTLHQHHSQLFSSSTQKECNMSSSFFCATSVNKTLRAVGGLKEFEVLPEMATYNDKIHANKQLGMIFCYVSD